MVLWYTGMCVHCRMDRDEHAPDGKCLFESTSFESYRSPKLVFDAHELGELRRRETVVMRKMSWWARVKAWLRR
jgi:hypothetical protein